MCNLEPLNLEDTVSLLMDDLIFLGRQAKEITEQKGE